MKNTQVTESQEVKKFNEAKKLGQILYDLEVLSIETGISVRELCEKLTRISEKKK